jgi:hypothetical protein
MMWVGSESYKTIKDWTDEAIVQGISKRLPNAAVGRCLAEEGTVIFVAHDEGVFHECPDCIGVVENPEARKMRTDLERVAKEVEGYELALESTHEESEEYVKSHPNAGSDDENIVALHKESTRLMRLIARRNAKYRSIEEELETSREYVEGGTGGHVHIMSDGGTVERWDYRKYNYWLHQPKKFDVNSVVKKNMCESCGGTGQLPDAKIFGVFIPSAVEYILKPCDDEEVKKRMEARGISTVTQTQLKSEVIRKCGKRHEGGVYIVASTSEEPTKQMVEVVEELVKKGLVEPDGVEIKGDFVRFIEPVETEVKRFRGIKSWCLDPRAEEEAEMIFDAM